MARLGADFIHLPLYRTVVEAEGDYARLHSESGAHLVRIPLSALESRWRDRGFQRIHRSYLVALRMVVGLRSSDGAVLVRLRANGASPAIELPVSRRQARELRDRVIREPMRNLKPPEGKSAATREVGHD